MSLDTFESPIIKVILNIIGIKEYLLFADEQFARMHEYVLVYFVCLFSRVESAKYNLYARYCRGDIPLFRTLRVVL